MWVSRIELRLDGKCLYPQNILLAQSFLLNLFIFIVHVCNHLPVCVKSGQLGGINSFHHMGLGIELRLSDLVASAYIC